MNVDLPITAFKAEILEAVNGNLVTIITAETGAGKSTQVPQFLLEAGHTVVVTQPRRLAARTVAERVAQEVGCKFGDIVGFRTAFERADSPNTRCLFVTDGLALVRELMGAGTHNILVIDEVHEWNLNIEVLVAWVRRTVASQDARFRVVLMSATLEAEKLATYFNGAPIILVPGRLFPVTEEKPQVKRLEEDVVRLLRQGRNVLVFQPGKREINETIDTIRKIGGEGFSAEILPLHGELESVDQRKCFAHYDRPKCVVSTNVAQTSVTIDDIDAVVDSGLERRIEVVDGVEGLYLKPISIADARQRKGRAGRCKSGIYIDWYTSIDRLEFPRAEILRTRLDQTVLRLAEAGFDMESLEFFHQPAKEEIHEAKRSLRALGCLDASGQVTHIGHRVAKLPVSVQFGRMIVEAERLGVVDDVITIAAILEQGEITARPREKYEEPAWKALIRDERMSDILAQLSVWKQAERMRPNEMLEKGVFPKAFYMAKEKRRHLADGLRGKVREFRSTGKRDDILRAVCAGMVDHLYQNTYGGWKNGDDQVRTLARESVVTEPGKWLVGLPFDIQIKTKRGSSVLRLVRMVTAVDPAWLIEIAPHLVRIEKGLYPKYDPQQKVCVSTSHIFFNDQLVREETVADPQHLEATQVYVEFLFSSFQKPQLAEVDKDDESAIIPNVQECIVGTHPETGVELKLYGTHELSFWSSVRAVWVRDVDEACALRTRLIEDLARHHESQRALKAEEERVRAEKAEQERIRLEEENKRTAEEEAARIAAEAEVKRDADAAAAGLPSDVQVWHKERGTGAGAGWVITPEGHDRPNTSWLDPNSRRFQRYGEGTKIWKQIYPGELVLRWRKAFARAPHCFEVVCRPKTLTEAQLERIRVLQAEIQQAHDIVSIEGGWGILPKEPESGRKVMKIQSRPGEAGLNSLGDALSRLGL